MSSSTGASPDWSGRWGHVSKYLDRHGPFTHPDFEPGHETLENVHKIPILVIGAGGLGCELLKDLALLAFRDIHIIDCDTIDLSNLNRQFLFRSKDIGRPKADVAAQLINSRITGCTVTPHFKKIQEYGPEFYSKFKVIICGLDSINARRWINQMVHSLLYYDDGMLDMSTVIPMIDGGTEGFKGNARVIIPGVTPCFECSIDLFPPQINYPLCTIAHIPRMPEHCIEYVRILQWSKDKPFGEEISIDGDDPAHVQWIYEKSIERAQQFNIEGVTYRLTQGVIKHIIPAVASTNAVIAAACATEAFKFATNCSPYMNNYMVFNNSEGIYTHTCELSKLDDCIVCAPTKTIKISASSKLQDVINYLKSTFDMNSPGITTYNENDQFWPIYFPVIAPDSSDNLNKSLDELKLCDGQQLTVTDSSKPNAMTYQLKFTDL